MPSDTPPAPPVAAEKLTQLKTMQDVIAVTLLADGQRAPAELVLPQLLNRRQTLEYMRVHYPMSMRDSVTQTLPVAWVYVDERGRVGRAKLVVGSGYAPLDSLSISVFNVAWFKPAERNGQPVGVWVPMPARIPPHDELIGVLKAAEQVKSEAPVSVAYTVKPVLLNRAQVEAAIIRVVHNVNSRALEASEAFNRAQRVGGTVQLWLFIDANGAVANALVKKTSGNIELDNSALQVARIMRFSPAKDGATPVDVWIEAPIKFKP